MPKSKIDVFHTTQLQMTLMWIYCFLSWLLCLLRISNQWLTQISRPAYLFLQGMSCFSSLYCHFAHMAWKFNAGLPKIVMLGCFWESHWIQEFIKGILNSGLFMAVGAAEKKNLNCQKYATFEVIFLCFHGQKNFLKTF